MTFEGFLSCEAASSEVIVAGTTDLRAGLVVVGSKDGSSDFSLSSQVLYNCLTLSPSRLFVSGVKVTDLRFALGVGIVNGNSTLSLPAGGS